MIGSAIRPAATVATKAIIGSGNGPAVNVATAAILRFLMIGRAIDLLLL